LTIRCGRSRWTLPTLPVADFPILPVDSLCAPMPGSGRFRRGSMVGACWSRARATGSRCWSVPKFLSQ
jgi:hypothetical protein